MKIRFIAFAVSLAMLMLMPICVFADIGPKPSVSINFENMGDELCYGTLLSAKESTGPYSVWDGDEDHKCNYDLDESIWRAFAEYEDADGYYFLQIGWKVSDTKNISWTYYPPTDFKILLYYPENDIFIASDAYEKYAFDTYYSVDMQGINIADVVYDEYKSTDERLQAYQAYNYRLEISGFIIRVIITAAIELFVAFLFFMRNKKQFLMLALVNLITQILLNLLLNLCSRNNLVLVYIFSELAVVVIEAIIYCRYLNRWAEKSRKKWYYIIYAVSANALSLVIGLAVADNFPQIF